MENKEYQIVNGTSYHKETPILIINILEEARIKRTRIVLDYGDTKTGKSWNEEFNITGYVGRSTGTNKIPILVFNSRCYGGGSILDNCIIGIKTSKGKKTLYKQNQTY